MRLNVHPLDQSKQIFLGQVHLTTGKIVFISITAAAAAAAIAIVTATKVEHLMLLKR